MKFIIFIYDLLVASSALFCFCPLICAATLLSYLHPWLISHCHQARFLRTTSYPN